MSRDSKKDAPKIIENTPRSSRLRGFYKLSRWERIEQLRLFANLPVDQTRNLSKDGALGFDLSDLFIENAIGSFPLPLGVATSFKINGLDYVVPMAVEESSVIAAASNAARCIYECGGFQSETVGSQMIGQIQVLDIPRHLLEAAQEKILSHKSQLLEKANSIHPRMTERGGGAGDIEVRIFPDAEIPFLVLHVLVNTCEAMGANLINTVCEGLAPDIEELLSARVGLRILSNLADHKTFRARALIKKELLSVDNLRGEEVAKRIFEAFVFADSDPYRAATHNKGIMNGVDPVVIATGNDWRAIEAGAHAFAARTGRYRSLSKWRLTSSGDLAAELELPMQLGTVGGITRLHPLAKFSLQLLGSPSSDQLSQIAVCVGLASNLSALRALVTSGIQKGHMRLHAKNIALAVGAKNSEVEVVAQALVSQGTISESAAQCILQQVRSKSDRAIAR